MLFSRRQLLTAAPGLFVAGALAGTTTRAEDRAALTALTPRPGEEVFEIWDLHGHLSGVAGSTPEERMERLVEHADRMGITCLCIYMGMDFALDPSPEEFRTANNEVMAAITRFPERALGFVYLNPKHVSESLVELDRCVGDGPMVGVKLWVAMHADAPELDPIVTRATELNAVVFQHTWIKITGNLAGESTPMQLAALAQRHPEAQLICGHSGGDWEQGIRAVRAHANIAVDLAGGDPVSGITEMAVRELGPERVIFGSDVPGQELFVAIGESVRSRRAGCCQAPDLLGQSEAPPASNLRRQGAPAVTDSIIDVNVNLSRWPTRRVRDDTAPRLAAKLASCGVVEAWAGSFDGLLHKDLAAVNARLVEECREQSSLRLIPFGSVNPLLPDWEEDVRRCHEVHQMPGIRLNPNYHGYMLDDPVFARLLDLATRRHLIVALAVVMEDERMMHPLMRVPMVDISPLAGVVARTPGLRLLLLNALTSRRSRDETLPNLLRAGDILVEISMLEGLGCMADLLRDIPLDRVLFGSGAPAQYFESALLKLQESELASPQLRAVRYENARRLLPSTS